MLQRLILVLVIATNARESERAFEIGGGCETPAMHVQHAERSERGRRLDTRDPAARRRLARKRLDARARRLVARIDAFASARGVTPRGPAATVDPVEVDATPTRLSLRDEHISTVIWATGFRRDYSWLRVPGVLHDGELIHDCGVTPAPGLYALGLRFQRRRNSNFLDGVGDDARTVVDHLVRRLDRRHAA